MNIQNGIVKYGPGKIFPGKYGTGRQNIVVTLENGTEEKIYFDEGTEPHCKLRKGDEVALVFNGNKKSLAIRDQQHQQHEQRQRQTSQQYHKPKQAQSPEEIAIFIDQHSKILRFCWDKAKMQFPELEESDNRALATTLYLSTCRKFNLQ